MILLPKLWRDERLKAIIFFTFLCLGAFLQVFFWPMISEMLPAMQKNIPEPFKGMFEGMASQGYIYYVITQHFMKILGFFGSFFAILLAASAMARELENRTMELLLAQPVTRRRVYLEKFGFAAIILAATVVVSTLLLSPASAMVEENIDLWNAFLASLIGFLVLMLIFSVVLTVSLYLEDQMQTISLGLGLSILMSLLLVTDATKRFSLYQWLDSDFLLPVLKDGQMPWLSCAILLLLTVAVGWLGLRRFSAMNI